MNRKQQLSALTGTAVGLIIAMGSTGCLLSAFHLTLAHPAALWGSVILLSLLYAQCLRWKPGPLAFACLLALAAGYLWRQGTAPEQAKALLQHLSQVYDRAYHWGALSFPDLSTEAVDIPLGIWALLTAVAAVRSICLSKKCFLPVLAALVPFAACVVVTDTVPQKAYLFLLLAGLLLLIFPAAVRREDPWQSIRLTAMAVLPVALGLGGLFLAIPQEGYVNRTAIVQENLRTAAENFPTLLEDGLANTAADLLGAPAKAVDLSRLGQRVSFTYPVVEVTAEKGGAIYLREQDYDQYNGLGWTASKDRQETFSRPNGQTQTLTLRTKGVKQVQYLPYYPDQVTNLAGGRLENPERTTEFTLSQVSLPEDWRQNAYLSTADGIPEDLTAYLSLPEATRQAAIPLLEHLYQNSISNTAKADIIAALVTDCAAYDLSPERMPAGEPDFALWFLQEGKSGYCIHFATTATVLLRAAGIPARYVTGYLAEAAPGETVTVIEEDSHAWAEYYEPALGCWIPLEATPASDGPTPTATVPATYATIAATEPESPDTTPTMPVFQPQTPTDTSSAPAKRDDGKRLLSLLLIPILVFFLAVQRTVRLDLRRKRQRNGEPNTQALYRFREAERLARLLKETPAEELIELAQKAKYSQHALTGEELQQFDSYCRSCQRRLKDKPFWLRLIYQYIYAVY